MMDLSKIINLFESKHTAALSDRHAAAISQLCSEKLGGGASVADIDSSKAGFYYKDLPEVAKIVEYCFRGVQQGKVSISGGYISIERVDWWYLEPAGGA
jgi:hypothetical protein